MLANARRRHLHCLEREQATRPTLALCRSDDVLDLISFEAQQHRPYGLWNHCDIVEFLDQAGEAEVVADFACGQVHYRDSKARLVGLFAQCFL